MGTESQDHNCDHTGCCGSKPKVEYFQPLDTSTVSLEKIAKELARLNDNLEKLFSKDPYLDNTKLQVLLDVSPAAIQKLALASQKK